MALKSQGLAEMWLKLIRIVLYTSYKSTRQICSHPYCGKKRAKGIVEEGIRKINQLSLSANFSAEVDQWESLWGRWVHVKSEETWREGILSSSFLQSGCRLSLRWQSWQIAWCDEDFKITMATQTRPRGKGSHLVLAMAWLAHWPFERSVAWCLQICKACSCGWRWWSTHPQGR